MILTFKPREFKMILQKYEKLLLRGEQQETDIVDDEFFVLDPYKIQIPGIPYILRYAGRFIHIDRCLQEDEEEEWVFQSEVFLLYEENCEDINDYKYYTAGSFYYTIKNFLGDDFTLNQEEFDQLDCTIDSSDYLSEDEEYLLLQEQENESADMLNEGELEEW